MSKTLCWVIGFGLESCTTLSATQKDALSAVAKLAAVACDEKIASIATRFVEDILSTQP